MRAHWTARRSNQLVLKKINPKNSLEQLKLQLQHFSHVMQRADSLERTLILGKIQGKRRSQQQKIRWLESISNSMDMNLRKLRKTVKDRRAWCAAVCGVTESDMT